MIDRNLPTPAELRALLAVAEHGSYRNASLVLELSPQTVKNAVSSVMRKTGAISASQAMFRLGFLSQRPIGMYYAQLQVGLMREQARRLLADIEDMME